jgi:threonine/homoserine/homoserine lactone efflux protein
MQTSFLLRGLIIGFSIAAPVGPISVLCIRRTLTDGWRAGLLSGLGAATADAVYGCVAGFGLAFVSSALITQHMWLRLAGGLFLCFLGARTFVSKPVEHVTSPTGHGLAEAYFSTLFLTITNPMTIMLFAGIFVGVGLAGASANFVSAGALVSGVFIGSALWWLVLTATVGLFQRKFSTYRLQLVNRISGAIVSAFGLLALLGLLT